MKNSDALEAMKIYKKIGNIYVDVLGKDEERLKLFKIFHRLLGNVKGKKILDVGCGFGTDAKELVKKKAKVFCLDISPTMLSLAKENCRGLEVNFYLGDMERTKFKNNSFDIIIAINSVTYKKNLKSVLKEFRRILKKDGEVFIVVPHPVRKMIKYTSNYFESGKHWENYKGIKWFNYYRTLEEYINTAISCGFKIKGIYEPKPAIRDKFFYYPTFLIMKLCKDKN